MQIILKVWHNRHCFLTATSSASKYACWYAYCCWCTKLPLLYTLQPISCVFIVLCIYCPTLTHVYLHFVQSCVMLRVTPWSSRNAISLQCIQATVCRGMTIKVHLTWLDDSIHFLIQSVHSADSRKKVIQFIRFSPSSRIQPQTRHGQFFGLESHDLTSTQ